MLRIWVVKSCGCAVPPALAGSDRPIEGTSTLRKLGLKGLIVTREDGWLLDPAAPFARVARLPDPPPRP